MYKLLTLNEVSEIMQISPSTIKRRVKLAREGKSSFPVPIFKKGMKCLWVADEIMSWKEDMPEVFRPDSPAALNERIELDLNRLRAMGMKIDEVGNTEAN